MFSIKDVISKCDQIRSFLRIYWRNLLKKSFMENFIFGAVLVLSPLLKNEYVANKTN